MSRVMVAPLAITNATPLLLTRTPAAVSVGSGSHVYSDPVSTITSATLTAGRFPLSSCSSQSTLNAPMKDRYHASYCADRPPRRMKRTCVLRRLAAVLRMRRPFLMSMIDVTRTPCARQ